jgi:hypothetical protein
MAGIYCGSNSLNPQLVGNGGAKTIGSRNQCLRKGIGQGLNMPVDLSYNNPYQPIDPRRFYCGNNAVLPVGYSANGTLQQCFNTGVGVGRRQLAQQSIAGPVALPVAGPVAGGGVPLIAAPVAGPIALPVAGGGVPLIAAPVAGPIALPVAGGGVPLIAAPVAGPIAAPVVAVPPVATSKYFLYYYITVFLLANAVFIISFLYAKPSFIVKDETKDKDVKEINWAVFSPYIAIFALVSGAILYRIYILYL